MNEAALKQYQSVGVQGSVLDASPHQLISMLLGGVLDRVASARGAIERDEISRKGELLSSAIAIVDNLRATLDHERGGEISSNLAALYDYIEQTLVQANMTSDAEKLLEVSALLGEIKSGWDAIPEEAKRSET